VPSTPVAPGHYVANAMSLIGEVSRGSATTVGYYYAGVGPQPGSLLFYAIERDTGTQRELNRLPIVLELGKDGVATLILRPLFSDRDVSIRLRKNADGSLSALR
jgi:hypothetical protein